MDSLLNLIILQTDIPFKTSPRFIPTAHRQDAPHNNPTNPPECVRVRVQQALLHLLVLDEYTICILEHKVVHLSSSCRPSHRVAKTLLDLADSLISPLGFSNFVRASRRTISDNEQTWAFAVVVSAIRLIGFFLSSQSPCTTFSDQSHSSVTHR